MAQMSDYLENMLVDHVFRNTTFPTPGTVYVALYSIDPTDADNGTELTGNGYARKEIVMGAATNGTSTNTADVLFDTASGDWTTVTHIGIRDAATTGNLLMHKILASSVTVTSGNNFRITAGDLELTFA